MTLQQKLAELPANTFVVWCKECGHVAVTMDKENTRLQEPAYDDCGLIIQTGTPEECIQAVCD